MTHLQQQLDDLRELLSDMSSLVKSQVNKSMESLFDMDEDLANEVLFNEKRVNVAELIIDKACENIFALLSPVAQDMRFVFATLKVNADLERIGDYAEGIAKLVLLGEKKFNRQLMEILQINLMYDTVTGMLSDVDKAYCSDDSKLARSVFARDKILNDINRNATPLVIEFCKNDMDSMEQALLLLSIVRKLERVGDHITNIAEEVIFYKEAKVLKHGNKGGSDTPALDSDTDA